MEMHIVIIMLGSMAFALALIFWWQQKSRYDLALGKSRQEHESLLRIYEALSEINQSIVRTSSRKALFAEMCRVLVDHGKFKMAWIGLEDPSTRKVVVAAAYGEGKEYADRLNIHSDDRPEGRGPSGLAIRGNQPVVSNDFLKDERTLLWHALAEQFGVGSSAAFPLHLKHQVYGVLTVYSSEPGYFQHQEMALLEKVAADISYALEKLDHEAKQESVEILLRESEENFRALFASMREMVVVHEVVTDPDGRAVDYRILNCNPVFLATTGLDRSKVIGALASELFGVGKPPYLDIYAEVARTGKPVNFETYFAPMRKHFSVYAFSPKPGRFATVTQDVTLQTEAAEQVRRTQEEWEQIFQAISEPAAILSPSHGLISANKALVQATGKTEEELKGLKCWQIFHGSDAKEPVCKCPMEAALASGHPAAEEVEVQTLGGTYLVSCTPVKNAAGEIEKIIHIATNITEFKRLQNNLLQAQKMETVGRLAGGVAHDFNNILQTILGCTELLLQVTPRGDDRQRDILDIKHAGERAAGLTRQLLAFSRKQVLMPRIHDLNDVITRLGKMLVRLIGEDVKLKLQLAPDVWPAQMDAGQIDQALMNLAVNARDAMPDGGQLFIRTANLTLVDDDLPQHPEGRCGRFICISVEDNGCGMSTEVRDRIFEPFFTTKPQGKGTGLGLAMVYGIVKQHEGWITVYSEPGNGTILRIYLPAAEPGISESHDAAAVSAPLPMGQGQNILIVEDDPNVRRLENYMLGGCGYSVTVAGTCAEAIAIYGERFSLVLSDVILPDGNGFEMMKGFQRINPDVRCVLSSGYSDIHERWPEIEEHGWLFLNKPFSKAELLNAVAAALSRA